MIKKIEEVLNDQLQKEALASQIYLAMASWAEKSGYEGIALFLYAHANEEREHMLKLFHYINDRGGHAIVPELPRPKADFETVRQVFIEILDHEIMITNSINDIVTACRDEKDYATENFIQWFVAEQVEEESMVRSIIDKLELLGDEKSKMYLFDRELKNSVAVK